VLVPLTTINAGTCSQYVLSKMNNVSTVVIGGSGTLGKAIARYFSGTNKSVKTIGRSHSNNICLDVIQERDRLEEVLSFLNPAVVVNCAAIVSLEYCEKNPREAFELNAYFVQRLASICNNIRCTLVHISTDHYFNDSYTTLHDESSPVHLVNTYSGSKYLGEVFSLSIPQSIVIRTNFSGFRMKSSQTYFEWLISALQSGKEIPLFDDFYTSTLDTFHLCQSINGLLGASFTGLINISSSKCLSKKDFALKFADFIGRECNYISISSDALYPKRNKTLGLDCSLAESILGVRMPDTESVFTKVVNQYFDFTGENLRK
jgi:dTDP-4-dehydrorhamnose reductase